MTLAELESVMRIARGLGVDPDAPILLCINRLHDVPGKAFISAECTGVQEYEGHLVMRADAE